MYREWKRFGGATQIVQYTFAPGDPADFTNFNYFQYGITTVAASAMHAQSPQTYSNLWSWKYFNSWDGSSMANHSGYRVQYEPELLFHFR